ncbi:MAG: recombinase family protein [Bacteroidetes bacterium]|nr:recombinase family protein [Bacteroidota bacterium]
MDTAIWSRVSSDSQNNQRQISNLKTEAEKRGWTVKRVFKETVSGTIKTTERKEFNTLLEYVKQNNIEIVLISEISRIGRKVVDVLNVVDIFHQNGIGIYVQQFNMISFEKGKENPMVMLLLQVLAIGAQMENDHRRSRQKQGIELARMQNKYAGRKPGSIANTEKQLEKYSDVVDLLKKSKLSLRRISEITGRSTTTIVKVKKLLAA